ncbi:endonuclease/exonuclease/phosphatase [Gimesia sp.]|uniref:endonuclease/exonuclease/phosphatase n=1 Tax=Gimesia sp. TaxID=2024833 RepID=UPI003A8D3635
MAKFNKDEWKLIRDKLNSNPQRYGLPARVYGSAVVGSANIRKLGAKDKRDPDTWQFFADVFRHFDLLAVQEVLEDMGGLKHLKNLMGDDFGLVASDTTGSFPNEGGLSERLAFIFNWTVVNRKEMVTDVTYDRSKVLQILGENAESIGEAVNKAIEDKKYLKKLDKYNKALADFQANGGREPQKPTLPLKMPVFLSFIRTPFAVMFEIHGHPGAERYTFMAINAHLYYGNYIDDRRQEFDALMSWIMGRVSEKEADQSFNIVLLGDLNLDFDQPDNDRPRILRLIEKLNKTGGKEVNVYFPFLNEHPQCPDQQLQVENGILTTNARLSETFDQIGIFSRDPRLKKFKNQDAGKQPCGPDFGVFDFVNLFSEALLGKQFGKLPPKQAADFVKRFEHSVSDHMPLWYRIPLPKTDHANVVTAP